MHSVDRMQSSGKVKQVVHGNYGDFNDYRAHL
jgi:hypothetical protein